MQKKKMSLEFLQGTKNDVRKDIGKTPHYFSPYSKMKKIEEHNLRKDLLIIELVLIGVTF